MGPGAPVRDQAAERGIGGAQGIELGRAAQALVVAGRVGFAEPEDRDVRRGGQDMGAIGLDQPDRARGGGSGRRRQFRQQVAALGGAEFGAVGGEGELAERVGLGVQHVGLPRGAAAEDGEVTPGAMQQAGDGGSIEQGGAGILLDLLEVRHVTGIDAAGGVARVGDAVGDKAMAARQAAGGDRGRADPRLGRENRAGAHEIGPAGREIDEVRSGVGAHHVGAQPVKDDEEEFAHGRVLNRFAFDVQ